MGTEFSETWCYETLRRLRWPRGLVCPLCGSVRATTHSKSEATPRRRYLCLACRRTFTDLTATPLARTNLPLGTWFVCLGLFGERYTTSELARRLGVKWDTTAHLQRRLAVGLSRPGLIRQLRDALNDSGAAPRRGASRLVAS